MDAILIGRDGEQFGPYTREELTRYLEAGNIVRSDLAWAEGMADWITVDQLSSEMVATPPQKTDRSNFTFSHEASTGHIISTLPRDLQKAAQSLPSQAIDEGADLSIVSRHALGQVMEIPRAHAANGPTLTHYVSYSYVPWYRQMWCSILCCLVFPPALLVTVMTGTYYYNNNNVVNAYSRGWKIVLIGYAILWTLGIAFLQKTKSLAKQTDQLSIRQVVSASPRDEIADIVGRWQCDIIVHNYRTGRAANGRELVTFSSDGSWKNSTDSSGSYDLSSGNMNLHSRRGEMLGAIAKFDEKHLDFGLTIGNFNTFYYCKKT